MLFLFRIDYNAQGIMSHAHTHIEHFIIQRIQHVFTSILIFPLFCYVSNSSYLPYGILFLNVSSLVKKILYAIETWRGV